MIFLRSVSMKSLPEEQSFPFNLPVIRGIDEIVFSTPVTFLAGENGSGKSTLIEAIAAGMGAITIGSHDIHEDPTLQAARTLGARMRFVRNRSNRSGFFFRAEDAFGFTKRIIQEQQDLEDDEREIRDASPGSGKNMAASVIRGQRMQLVRRYGEDPDAQSHGESFLHVLEERMVPDGLYLLDEPETPLSPMRQLVLLSMIAGLSNAGCQFIIATHSPILMACPKARILVLNEGTIEEVPYDQTEHVVVTRDFLNNPEKFLRYL